MAAEKWGSNLVSHETRVDRFVSRVSQAVMVKTLSIDKLLLAQADDEVMATDNQPEDGPLEQRRLNTMLRYAVQRHLEATDKWVSLIAGPSA